MIRTFKKEDCVACGKKGRLLYEGLTDELFGVQGEWSLWVCKNEECGLVWQNPMPVKGDLALAYEDYYTHSKEGSPATFSMRCYNYIVNSYINRKYGYNKKQGRTKWLTSYLIYLMPGIRALADARVCCLHKREGARLLEVGCGSGKTLHYLKGIGWDTEGIDFDEKAINSARARGLNVYVGDMESRGYPDNSFDVIISKHVIEHVPNPQATFDSFFRVLRHGGVVVLYTPNVNSFGHRVFKKHWRGLEPPRHLHVFNSSALERMLASSGFHGVEVTSTYAGSPILLASAALAGYAVKLPLFKNLLLLFMHYVEWLIVTVDKDTGEELIAVAKKR